MAATLHAWGLRANQVSLTSVAAALLGAGLALLPWPGRWQCLGLIGLAAGAQLRLLCNLFDGMLAVEHGQKSATGELYNEVPDRFADVVLLATAGYLTTLQPWGHVLGWSAACLAVTTAYVRALGGQLTGTQDFAGIMAKPNRMFVLIGAALLKAGLVLISWQTMAEMVFPVALALMVIGAGWTIRGRLVRLARCLRGGV